MKEIKFWGDQYDMKNVDMGHEEGEEREEIKPLFPLRDAVLKGASEKKPGWCGNCNARMRVLTATINKKRQKVGAICPVCFNIINWVG